MWFFFTWFSLSGPRKSSRVFRLVSLLPNWLPAASCGGKIWLPAALCSGKIWLPAAKCSGEIWLLAASCSRKIWLPTAKCSRKISLPTASCSGKISVTPHCIMQREDFCNNHWLDSLRHHTAERFDSLLQHAGVLRFDNAAGRFDSLLHHAAGSQTLIITTLWIWKQIWKKLRIWIRVKGGYFWWKKTEKENLMLLSLQSVPGKKHSSRKYSSFNFCFHYSIIWNPMYVNCTPPCSLMCYVYSKKILIFPG